jgi:bacterioferritin-associated ferredoxin
MHYWGIVCSVCRDAKDSKDFTKDFIKKVGLELEETTPIGENCGICISNSKNY